MCHMRTHTHMLYNSFQLCILFQFLNVTTKYLNWHNALLQIVYIIHECVRVCIILLSLWWDRFSVEFEAFLNFQSNRIEWSVSACIRSKLKWTLALVSSRLNCICKIRHSKWFKAKVFCCVSKEKNNNKYVASFFWVHRQTHISAYSHTLNQVQMSARNVLCEFSTLK